jgi:hypothetical protein
MALRRDTPACLRAASMNAGGSPRLIEECGMDGRGGRTEATTASWQRIAPKQRRSRTIAEMNPPKKQRPRCRGR